MAYKNKEDQLASQRRHYQRNKEAYIARAAQKKLYLRQFIADYKASKPCMDCDMFYPYYVMDFDHLRDKVNNIAHMANMGSISKLKAEMEKCELVCSNCHRIRTHKRLQQ